MTEPLGSCDAAVWHAGYAVCQMRHAIMHMVLAACLMGGRTWACGFFDRFDRMTEHPPVPRSITLHAASRTLELVYDGGTAWHIPLELMRVYSPSAEVRGHGPGQAVLQTGKRHVGITGIAPVGNYGIRPTFSDGHDSGIFTWQFLYELGRDGEQLWQQYLERLAAAGVDRDAPMPTARVHSGVDSEVDPGPVAASPAGSLARSSSLCGQTVAGPASQS